MIKSMTGYGKAFLDNDDLSINVEVRSLNSKFLDLSFRTQKDVGEREMELRNVVAQKLGRGKVNLSVDILRKGEPAVKINYDQVLFKAYYHQLMDLANQVGADTSEVFRMAIQSPEVSISNQTDPLDDQDWDLIQGVLDEALDQCNRFREKEGNVLFEHLAGFLGSITQLLVQVENEEPDRVVDIRERINKNLLDLQSKMDVDQNRLEQELIYYLERLDITEEMDRLRSHLTYFQETLNDEESQGKKLSFIAQEMGREINTIGSKASRASIQKLVVAMKDELEKIKEQLYNIL